MNEELKQKIINRALVENEPLKDIAKTLFISERQLKLLFTAWGVEIVKKRKYKIVDMPERDELMRKYNEVGTTPALAKVYGVGINTVNKWMKKMEIPTRKLTSLTPEEKIRLLESHLGKLNM